jgi:orotidine-5'-phosphate decarboxylase
VRSVCGEEFCLAVPGIRPAGSNGDDQVRVLTPAAAQAKGADYVVVGRPVTDAADPQSVARGILLDLR